MMKTNILIAAVFLFSFRLFAQETENNKFTLYLSVKDKDGVSVANQNLWLSDKESVLDFYGKTNAKGQCNFVILKGKTYSLNFPDSLNFEEIKTPALTSTTSFLTKSILYTASSKVLVKTGVSDTVRQSYTSAPQYTKTESAVVVKVMDAENITLKNLDVRLNGSSLNKVYIANTGKEGSACFLIPAGVRYKVGIETYDNYSEFTLPAAPLKMVKALRYEPTNIVEEKKNDTITQIIPEGQKPTSARVHILAKVMNFDGENLPDEEIYVDIEDDSVVYKAVTDKNGNAQFMIPKGKKFILNFRYERSVDHLDYTNIDPLMMHNVDIEYKYIGSKKVQEYYATVKRNEDGFLSDFMEMNLDKISAEEAKENIKVKKTVLGYNIDFGSADYIPSSYVTDDKVYIGGAEGYEFYCLDSKTGNFKWGVGLREGGQSSVACDSDVIVINTESCTLYAIDRNDGNLLWSKWLGPDLYSSPAVYMGKVYVTYPNNIDNIRNDKYVLMCLNLSNGKIIWQKFIDTDVLASPVVDGNYVYVSTRSGKLSRFNAADGNNLMECDGHAVSPPTIANGLLYVSMVSKTDKNIQELAIYDASTMKLINRVPGINSAIDDVKDYNETMNYSNGRVMNYNGNNYNFTDDKLVCSRGSDGAILWTADVSAPADTLKEISVTNIPVVAGGKIIITTMSGKIKAYDPLSGKLLKEFDAGVSLTSPPVVSNGWIYAGSADGQLISVDTKDASYTGWGMWNLNGAHNTAVK
jgi:outer membrane protein assembly factor BamB